jgi:hypothetical protein
MVSARKFADLKTAPLGVEIAPLESIDRNVRQVQCELEHRDLEQTRPVQ